VSKRRILIVEDEGIVARDLARTLQRLGYAVPAIASSGDQAIKEAAESQPDLVLMDIKLKGEMDGIQAADRIRARFDVPVVYLTAYADEKTLQRAKITEPFGYVLKPFQETELLSVVEIALHRHEMGRRLKESERRFRSLIENASDIIMLLAGDRTIRYSSPAVEKVLGYEPESLVDRDISEFLHPHDAARIRRVLAESLSEPAIFHLGEARFRHQDGSWHWLDTIGNNRLADPAVRGIVVNCHDVTERKRAEKAQRASEQELALTLDATTEGIWKWDFRSDELSFSPRYYTMLGYEPDEFPAGYESWASLIHPDDLHQTLEVAAQYLATRPDVYENEFRLRTKSGDYRWIRAEGRVVARDEQGHALRMIGNHRDITERKRAEHALERELRRVSLLNDIARAIAARHDLQSILQAVVEQLEGRFADVASVWLRDHDTEVFTAAAHGARSEAAATRLALPRRIAMPSGQGGLRLLLQEGLDYVADLAVPDVPLVEPWVASEVRSAVVAPLTSEGDVFGALVSARRQVDAFTSAECEFLRGLSKHVSLAIHQAQLHQDLQTAYDDLHQTQRAMTQQERLRGLGEMASGIAHDINNAISPISLYIDLIERETNLSERARDHLRIIRTAVEDVGETVRLMRQFYRQWEEDRPQPVDVNQAVREAIELARPRWRDVPQGQAIAIELHTDFHEDMPPVMGNDGEIRQAVMNLVFNAVDAMPSGGTLSLHTRMEAAPPTCIIEVSDTGIGMDEETQKRCLEPFFSTKGERGTGMGLAMVYGSMQRHFGDVQVQSAPGEGTTVRLIFPIGEVPDADPAADAVAPPAPLRVLCIDDDPVLRQALKRALEGVGHTVRPADGGKSGLEEFRAARHRGEPFEAVITDLVMPNVDGRELAQTVKQEAPETPVILLTGRPWQVNAQDGVPEGVDLMLSKPPQIEALIGALSQVTRRD
jgi:PAS domain S-box-containing protein